MIRSITYRPSAVKTFYHHCKRLNDDEVRIVVDIVKHRLSLKDPRICALPIRRKALVLALASEYLALLINKDVIDRKISSELTLALFAERIRLSNDLEFEKLPTPTTSPEAGHKTHQVHIGWGHGTKSFLSFGYKDAYHGLLDPLPGFEKGAEVEFFNIELNAYEPNFTIELDKFQIMNITSLTPVNPFFKPASWNLSLGSEQREMTCERELVTFLEASLGMTFAFGCHQLSTLAYFETAFCEAFEQGYGLAPGLYLSLMTQKKRYSYDLGVLSIKYLVGDNNWYTKLWGEINFPLGKNNAAYSKVEYTPTSENRYCAVSFGLRHYF